MPKSNPDKPTNTTIHDIIGKDAAEAIFDEVRDTSPRYLVVIWTVGEQDGLRWQSTSMTDATFVYMLEATKHEFLNQDAADE